MLKRFTTLIILTAGFLFNAMAQDPSVAAPTPDKASEDVISVYSDTYTSIYTDLSGSWSDSDHSELQVEGDNFVKYIPGGAGNQKASIDVDPFPNVTAMEYLHIDYYINDANSVLLFGLYSNGDSPFFNMSADGGGMVAGSWQSVDIPLSHFSSLTLDQVQWVRIEIGAPAADVYIDNVYFWKAPSAPGSDASLSDITVDGTSITGFDPLVKDYVIFQESTTVPVVTATTTDTEASAVVTDSDAVPGATTIAVTSSNGNVTDTYNVWFTGAATDPDKDAANVISVYSDSYTSIATNLNPAWGQATVMTEFQLGTNNIMKYAGLNYQGLEYTNPTDVTAFEYVHFDYYTLSTTSLEFFLIAGGENAYNVGTELGITTGEWVGVDIPLSYFEDAGRDLSAAFQFKTVGNGTLYYDNIYFWKNPSGAGQDISLSDLTVDGTTIDGFTSSKSSYTVDLPIGTTTVPTVDVATTDAAATYVVTPAAGIPGSTSVEVTSSDGTVTGTYTVNFTATIPPSAAPVPTHAASDVISVFSDDYTSIATNLNPNWGQATVVTELLIEGNNTLKYASLNYQGTEYTNPTDVSEMEYVHFDYYTEDASALNFYLIAGGENAYNVVTELGITTGEWVSVDIPLSFFADAGRDLTAAFQFKIEGDGTIYFDNMLFWKNPPAQGTDATLSDLQIDGVTPANFAVLQTEYNYDTPIGTTTVPTVTVTTSDPNATFVITPAAGIPGSTTVVVTSEDESATKTYTVNFTATIPLTAAPTPGYAAEDVISIYSDAYTSIATDINPQWSQQTVVTELQIEGNNTLKYANLNYQGMEYPNPTDVSSMNFVHVDYYTSDATALEFFIIADGENSYNIATELGIVTGSWTGVDIPLSFFADAGRDLTAAYQFKIVGNGTVYFDNFIFYSGPSNIATLSSITVDGVSLDGFAATTLSYDYEVPLGTTTVPVVDAVTTDANASYTVNAATGIPGSTTIVVTAEDGTSSMTYTINFEEEPDAVNLYKLDGLRVYPNPAVSELNIAAKATIKSLEIMDIGGKTILRNRPESSLINMDISTLPQGVYFLRVKSDTSSEIVKFVKQ